MSELQQREAKPALRVDDEHDDDVKPRESARLTQLKADAAAMSYNQQVQWLKPARPIPGLGGATRPAPQTAAADVQAKMEGAGTLGSVHDAAAYGVSGSGGSLPFADRIQQSFGGHDVSSVSAHVGGKAAEASSAMGALAYASGSSVAFKSAPDLHTAAHEAAHIVQQRQGVSLPGGVGSVGDKYEQHADKVADAVVSGRSAEGLLSGGPSGSGAGVQHSAEGGDVQHRLEGEEVQFAGGGTPLDPSSAAAQLVAVLRGFSDAPEVGFHLSAHVRPMDAPTFSAFIATGANAVRKLGHEKWRASAGDEAYLDACAAKFNDAVAQRKLGEVKNDTQASGERAGFQGDVANLVLNDIGTGVAAPGLYGHMKTASRSRQRLGAECSPPGDRMHRVSGLHTTWSYNFAEDFKLYYQLKAGAKLHPQAKAAMAPEELNTLALEAFKKEAMEGAVSRPYSLTGSISSGTGTTWWTDDYCDVIQPQDRASSEQAFDELCVLISLQPSWYAGGFIKFAVPTNGLKFHKPTVYDGMMSEYWVQAEDKKEYGVLGSGLKEWVTGAVPTDQVILSAMKAYPTSSGYDEQLRKFNAKYSNEDTLRAGGALDGSSAGQANEAVSAPTRARQDHSAANGGNLGWFQPKMAPGHTTPTLQLKRDPVQMAPDAPGIEAGLPSEVALVDVVNEEAFIGLKSGMYDGEALQGVPLAAFAVEASAQRKRGGGKPSKELAARKTDYITILNQLALLQPTFDQARAALAEGAPIAQVGPALLSSLAFIQQMLTLALTLDPNNVFMVRVLTMMLQETLALLEQVRARMEAAAASAGSDAGQQQGAGENAAAVSPNAGLQARLDRYNTFFTFFLLEMSAAARDGDGDGAADGGNPEGGAQEAGNEGGAGGEVQAKMAPGAGSRPAVQRRAVQRLPAVQMEGHSAATPTETQVPGGSASTTSQNEGKEEDEPKLAWRKFSSRGTEGWYVVLESPDFAGETTTDLHPDQAFSLAKDPTAEASAEVFEQAVGNAAMGNGTAIAAAGSLAAKAVAITEAYVAAMKKAGATQAQMDTSFQKILGGSGKTWAGSAAVPIPEDATNKGELAAANVERIRSVASSGNLRELVNLAVSFIYQFSEAAIPDLQNKAVEMETFYTGAKEAVGKLTPGVDDFTQTIQKQIDEKKTWLKVVNDDPTVSSQQGSSRIRPDRKKGSTEDISHRPVSSLGEYAQLSENEKLVMFGEAASKEKSLKEQHLTWSEGRRSWYINEADTFVQQCRDASIPLGAGVSGTTGRIMETSRVFNTGVSAVDMRAAAIGYLLPIRAHTLIEILMGAAPYGAGSVPSPPSFAIYANIEPLGDLSGMYPNETFGKLVAQTQKKGK